MMSMFVLSTSWLFTMVIVVLGAFVLLALLHADEPWR